jgi:hypothetical protein
LLYTFDVLRYFFFMFLIAAADTAATFLVDSLLRMFPADLLSSDSCLKQPSVHCERKC